jgi:hypothetical protein
MSQSTKESPRKLRRGIASPFIVCYWLNSAEDLFCLLEFTASSNSSFQEAKTMRFPTLRVLISAAVLIKRYDY